MDNIKLFEEKKVRSHWDEKSETWYFSVIDVIEILSESPRPRKYWNALKTKLQLEGSELSHKLGQLKMRAEDGKMRETDVADTETLLRIIQSIPSPKAELSTRQIAEAEKAKGLQENAKASKKGGGVAKNARKELESKTGKSVVTGENFLPPAKEKKKI